MSTTSSPEANFPAAVVEILRAAGWKPGIKNNDLARDWLLQLAASPAENGQLHQIVSPAFGILAEYGGLRLIPDSEGEQVAPSEIVIDPRPVTATVLTLAALAEVLGAPLTPIGAENGGAGILAVDSRGRVFVFDHTGEWHVGDTIAEAITTLLLGRRPHKLRDNGTW